MSGTPQRQTVDQPFASGDILVERFRVVRRIAQGGMGVVYEAYDEKLGRRIALKCARSGHGGHLSPEVRLATEVSHVNICKIFEIHTAQTPGGPLDFFTMEFLEGETLSQRLRKRSLRREETEAIARQICAGLAEAHRRQIIHGDLKSSNVILTRSPDGALRAVVTDFGLARAVSNPSSRGGSPGYMAPELYDGAPTTVASDIYALGAILHELVCGYLPHQRVAMLAPTVTQLAPDTPPSSDSRDLAAALSRTKLPPLKSRWDPIIAKCLQQDPRQRYETVEQVIEALGPSTVRRRVLLLAAALAFSAVAALVTYERATAPGETVRLDIAEVQAAPGLEAQARQVREGALREIGRLKNSSEIAFSVRGSGATHKFSIELMPKGGKLMLRAVLRELRSGATMNDWSADYAPAQLRYAPVALAGEVSSTLHLPALTTYATVNAAAAASYRQGIQLLEGDDSKLDEALADLQTAASLDPDSALPFAAMAEVQRRKFRATAVPSWHDQAVASLAEAELRNPDCAEVHSIAGLLAYDRSQQDEAIVRERRATELQPGEPDAWRRLGQLYDRNRQIPEALQAFRQAQSLAPRDVRTYQDLANLYNTQSNFVEASKALETAVALAPDRPLLHTRLASTYQDLGRFAEAEAQLRPLVQQNKSGDTLVALGHVLMYEKRDREAIPLLSEAARIKPKNPFAWLYLGLACQRSGDAPHSREAFQKGLAIAEDLVVQYPRSGYEHAVLAYYCAQNGQAGRAAVESAQGLNLAPRHNDTIWMATLTYERMGKRETALKTLSDAPRALLDDLRRWPEASALTGDERFENLIHSSDARR